MQSDSVRTLKENAGAVPWDMNKVTSKYVPSLIDVSSYMYNRALVLSP